MIILATIKRGAAAITDTLASAGARIPGVAQLTIAAGPFVVTVQPTPPPPPAPPPSTCHTCGR